MGLNALIDSQCGWLGYVLFRLCVCPPFIVKIVQWSSMRLLYLCHSCIQIHSLGFVRPVMWELWIGPYGLTFGHESFPIKQWTYPSLCPGPAPGPCWISFAHSDCSHASPAWLGYGGSQSSKGTSDMNCVWWCKWEAMGTEGDDVIFFYTVRFN